MPAVARIGDTDVPHCSGHNVQGGSSDVFTNGIGTARVGDLNTPHVKPGGDSCPGCQASISSGSSSVFVNGRPIARMGDPYGGCTSIAQGSPNVFAN